MHGTKREHMYDWFSARSPIKRGNSMTEEENGIIVDASFSTPSPSKKSLAVLGDCARRLVALGQCMRCHVRFADRNGHRGCTGECQLSADFVAEVS
jgi:hypothetical protein